VFLYNSTTRHFSRKIVIFNEKKSKSSSSIMVPSMGNGSGQITITTMLKIIADKFQSGFSGSLLLDDSVLKNEQEHPSSSIIKI